MQTPVILSPQSVNRHIQQRDFFFKFQQALNLIVKLYSLHWQLLNSQLSNFSFHHFFCFILFLFFWTSLFPLQLVVSQITDLIWGLSSLQFLPFQDFLPHVPTLTIPNCSISYLKCVKLCLSAILTFFSQPQNGKFHLFRSSFKSILCSSFSHFQSLFNAFKELVICFLNFRFDNCYQWEGWSN